MATELQSFERFVREQLVPHAQYSPTELLRLYRLWQKSQTSGGTTSQESLFDRLTRKGLLGTVQGGPDDLSSNPKHMEGFGQS